MSIDDIRRERADRIEQLREARARQREENRARMPDTTAIIDAFTEVFGPVKVSWAMEGDIIVGTPPPEEIERHRARMEALRAVREVRRQDGGAGEQAHRLAEHQKASAVRAVRREVDDYRAPGLSAPAGASRSATGARAARAKASTQARAQAAPQAATRSLWD